MATRLLTQSDDISSLFSEVRQLRWVMSMNDAEVSQQREARV